MWPSKLHRSASLLSLILFLMPAELPAVGGSLSMVTIDYYAAPGGTVFNPGYVFTG